MAWKLSTEGYTCLKAAAAAFASTSFLNRESRDWELEFPRS